MQIFLTGGSGFLGGRIAKALVENNHTVVASVRPGSHRAHLDALNITVVEGQLDDAAFLQESMRGCNALAHIAGAAGRFYADPGHYHSVNVDLTRSVFEAAADVGIDRAVMCGTVVIHQGLGNPYALSKKQGVAVARSIGGSKMAVMVVHPSGMVGPGDRAPTPLGRGLQQFADGKLRIALDGGGGFVHVDDAADMHVAALERGDSGEDYIANAAYVTLRALFASLAGLLDVPKPIGHLPNWAARMIAGFLEPICRILGVIPPMTQFTVSYLQQPPETTPDGAEDRARLGLMPYRSVETGSIEGIEWQRRNRQ